MYCNTPNPAKRKALWVPITVHNRGKHKKHAISYTDYSVDELKLRHHPDVVTDSVQDCRKCRCMITGRRPLHVATRTLPLPCRRHRQKQTPQARRARSTPETLSPEHAEELVQTASNGHTQAGATPPQSLPLCHAEERTTPGQQRLRLQGSEHHLRGRNVDVRPHCPRHLIILASIALYSGATRNGDPWRERETLECKLVLLLFLTHVNEDVMCLSTRRYSPPT